MVLKGAVFDLYNEAGERVEEGLATNEEGSVTVTGLRPGNYYFEETDAPEHYQLSVEQHEFTIERSQTTTLQVEVENQLVDGAVVLVKVDRANQDRRLAGAEFQLESVDGTILESNLVTDPLGQILIGKLEPGEYAFRETKAPTGYRLNRTPVQFGVEGDEQGRFEVFVTNTRRTSPPTNPPDPGDPGPGDPGEPDPGDPVDPGDPSDPGPGDPVDPGPGEPGSGEPGTGIERVNDVGNSNDQHGTSNENERKENSVLPQTGEERLLYLLISGILLLSSGIYFVTRSRRRRIM